MTDLEKGEKVEKAISDADSKAKAAKIAEMQNQLAAAKAASEVPSPES